MNDQKRSRQPANIMRKKIKTEDMKSIGCVKQYVREECREKEALRHKKAREENVHAISIMLYE
jgi:hypothetical protein